MADTQGLSATKKGAVTLVAIVGIGVATALGRWIPQEESGRKVEVSVNDDTSLNVRHISGKQYLKAYLDVAGVATACDGLIRDEKGRPIKPGQIFTEAQCADMLERALITHAQGAMACTPGIALTDIFGLEKRREGPRFAAVEHAYHFGIAAYCGSSVKRRFNETNYPAGCNALMAWNKARVKGVLTPLPGLTARQSRVRNVCLNGLGVIS